MSSNPARNHARRLSAFLSLVILLVGALGMTEKAYAVEAEPTGSRFTSEDNPTLSLRSRTERTKTGFIGSTKPALSK